MEVTTLRSTINKLKNDSNIDKETWLASSKLPKEFSVSMEHVMLNCDGNKVLVFTFWDYSI